MGTSASTEFKRPRPELVGMEVTVRVAGDEPRAVEVDPDATYADLLAAVDLTPHEATVLVDGQPVPADASVDAESVRVLELVKGG